MNFGQIFSHLFGQTLQPKELVWWPAVKPDHICVFVAPPCSYPGTTKQYTKTSKIHNHHHHHHHQRHLPFSRYHHQQPTYMYIYKYLHIHMSSYIMNIIRMCIYNAYNIYNIKLFSNTKAQGGCVLGSGSLPGTSTEKDKQFGCIVKTKENWFQFELLFVGEIACCLLNISNIVASKQSLQNRVNSKPWMLICMDPCQTFFGSSPPFFCALVGERLWYHYCILCWKKRCKKVEQTKWTQETHN